MRQLLNFLFLLVLLLTSCGKELPELKGIDTEKWKADRNACSGYRKSTVAQMGTEMVKLKGLSEMDILQLLGKPDKNELYKRNQKFYSYLINPGSNCAVPDSITKKMILRFTAMGYAQLVSIE